MKAFVFPGQGSQFPGMGKELYQSSDKVRELFDKACQILGFDIKSIMFDGDEEALKATAVTQPAVFLHSVASAMCCGEKPDAVAGHSLGEFSALVSCGSLSFEEALRLVAIRSSAMQQACEMNPGSMAAILKADEQLIADCCREVPGMVVPANFNSDVQVVISGEKEAVEAACALLRERGVRRAIMLSVGGAFHSPLMEPARQSLAEAIDRAVFSEPFCPIYQNVDALPHSDPAQIKANLLMQLTSPVRWTQTVRNMVADGVSSFVEIGPGSVLQGLVSRIAPEVETSGIS